MADYRSWSSTKIFLENIGVIECQTIYSYFLRFIVGIERYVAGQ